MEEGGGRDYQWKLEDTPVSVSQFDNHISNSTPQAQKKKNIKSPDPTERKESNKAMKTATETVGYTIS